LICERNLAGTATLRRAKRCPARQRTAELEVASRSHFTPRSWHRRALGDSRRALLEQSR
jgi:hypothetical protein